MNDALNELDSVFRDLDRVVSDYVQDMSGISQMMQGMQASQGPAAGVNMTAREIKRRRFNQAMIWVEKKKELELQHRADTRRHTIRMLRVTVLIGVCGFGIMGMGMLVGHFLK